MALNDSAGLLFKISADSAQAVNELREVKARIGEMSDQVEKSGEGAKRAGSAFKSHFLANLASNVVTQFTAQLTSGSKAILDYSARLEQTRIGFTTLMGSSQAAEKHLKDLAAFARTTPFEFEELTSASRRLQNVGVEGEKVIPIMQDIGNAAAAAGASSAELDSITLAFSQIIAKGKLSAEEVNQLAERGIPVWRMLSEELGKSKGEIIKLAEQGKISSDVFIDAFRRFSQANFGGAMEAQSKTFAGAMSTIKDVTLQVANEAFEPLFKQISQFAFELSKNQGKFEAWGKAGKQATQNVLDGLRGVNHELSTGGEGNGGLLGNIKSVLDLYDKFLRSKYSPITYALSEFGKAMTESGRQLRRAEEGPRRIDYSRPQDMKPTKASPTGGGPTEEEIKAQRDREKSELAGHLSYLSARQAGNLAYLARNRQAWEQAFKDQIVTGEQFQKAVEENEERFRKAAIANIEKTYAARMAQEKLSANQIKALKQEQENEIEAVIEESNKRANEAGKLRVEEEKRRNEEAVRSLRDRLERELSLKEAAARTVFARLQKDVEAGNITEAAALKARQDKDLEQLQLKLSNLEAERNKRKELGLETVEIENDIAIQKEAIDARKQEAARETNALITKGLQDEKRISQELLAIKRQIVDEERRILDFRAEQQRKYLQNTVDSSFGKARRQALEELRDFEFREVERKRREREDDLAAERAIALERVKGKENEEEQKAQIEELYRQKRLLSEAEFQAQLKSIRDQFNQESLQSQVDSIGGGALGGLLEGMRLNIEQMAQPVNSIAGLMGILGSQFQYVAQAAGQAVKAFVLFGSSGGSFRKFAAEVIATLAQMAAVQAIWEAAQAAAMWAIFYFTGSPAAAQSAVWHTSAAITYGLAAGALALTGRAIEAARGRAGFSRSTVTTRELSKPAAMHPDRREFAMKSSSRLRTSPTGLPKCSPSRSGVAARSEI